ncbi:MAG: hypothetical protein Ta2B_00900 [Termitinemataceae bacterium]|nr:MAG: hypothetical protein Ta2B_00900 [Termitinemataceae bacterium]
MQIEECSTDKPHELKIDARDDWHSLYGLCKNSGDTLDAFMERHLEDGRLELEGEE